MKTFLARLAIVPILAAVGWAQAASGTVNGSVSGAGGPVAGVLVAISSSSNSSYADKATTDQQGKFTISGAPLGSVELKAYDAQGNLLVRGTGTLTLSNQVITVVLQVP